MTPHQELSAWSTVVETMKAFIKNANHEELINIDNLVDYIVADDYNYETDEYELLASFIMNNSVFVEIFDDSDVILTQEQLSLMLDELEIQKQNAQGIVNRITI